MGLRNVICYKTPLNRHNLLKILISASCVDNLWHSVRNEWSVFFAACCKVIIIWKVKSCTSRLVFELFATADYKIYRSIKKVEYIFLSMTSSHKTASCSAMSRTLRRDLARNDSDASSGLAKYETHQCSNLYHGSSLSVDNCELSRYDPKASWMASLWMGISQSRHFASI